MRLKLRAFFWPLVVSIYGILIMRVLAAGESDTTDLTKPLLLDSRQVLVLLGFASLLCVAHLGSGKMIRFLRRYSHGVQNKLLKPQVIVSSLAGGMAISYVFLHLFPKLITANKKLEYWHPYIMLGGVLLFYGLEHLAHHLESSHHDEEWGFIQAKASNNNYIFILHIAFLVVYNALIIYTLPDHKLGLLKVTTYSLAMDLHLLSDDYFLEERYRKSFNQWGRYVLALAPLLGWLAAWLFPVNTLISNILLSLLTGFILINIFQDEISHNENSSYIWFFIGVVFYMILLLFAK